MVLSHDLWFLGGWVSSQAAAGHFSVGGDWVREGQSSVCYNWNWPLGLVLHVAIETWKALSVLTIGRVAGWSLSQLTML